MIPRIGAGTGVVFSDVHIPDHDRLAVTKMCRLISDIKPDFLVADGDIVDCAEFSAHEIGSVKHFEGRRWSASLAVAGDVFDEIDDAAGRRCKRKVFVGGNHEDRIRRWVARGDNAVFADDQELSIPYRLGFKRRGWEWDLDYPDAHVMAGKLLITHGQYAGKNAAKKHLDEYQCSILVGHTHTDQTYHGSTFEDQRVAHCQGALADFDADAFRYKRRPRNWIKGFSIVTVRPNGNFFIQPVRFVAGEFAFGGKVY